MSSLQKCSNSHSQADGEAAKERDHTQLAYISNRGCETDWTPGALATAITN